MKKPGTLKSVRPPRGAAAGPAAVSAVPEYSVTDYPMHYFAAVQRQNQINLTNALRPLGLSVQQWRVLVTLAEQDGRTVGQIAEVTVLDRSGLGRLLEQMEADGLVERTSPPDDRRAVLIRLAPEGRKRHAAALPLAKAHYRRLLRGVSSDEFKTLIRLLRRLKANALMMSDASISELE